MQKPAAAALRSIPACAGEPAAACTRAPTLSVYPRVCGGTLSTKITTGYQPGLSPRVRGTGVGFRILILVCGLSPRVRGNPQGA